MLYDTETFYGAWEHVINLFNDSAKIKSEVNFKPILQRLELLARSFGCSYVSQNIGS